MFAGQIRPLRRAFTTYCGELHSLSLVSPLFWVVAGGRS